MESQMGDLLHATEMCANVTPKGGSFPLKISDLTQNISEHTNCTE